MLNISAAFDFGNRTFPQPGEVQVIHAFRDQMILHLGGEDTGGEFKTWTNVTPPGGGPPPHHHGNEDDWGWLLSGSAESLIDVERKELPAKSAIFMLPRSIHSFSNPNEEELSMLIQTMP
tara:strand:- start:2514 stop:2873 length:360 start_codon:yes stop_codon:yes gene_type:complete